MCIRFDQIITILHKHGTTGRITFSKIAAAGCLLSASKVTSRIGALVQIGAPRRLIWRIAGKGEIKGSLIGQV